MRKHWPGELAFPVEDYRQRLKDCQQRLHDEDLFAAVIFDPENIYWLVGFQTIGYFTFQALYIPRQGLPVLVTRVVNQDLALALPTIGDAVAIQDTDDHIGVLDQFLSSNLPAGCKVGLETSSWYLKVMEYRQLAGNPDLNFVDWNGYIPDRRMIKTAAQVACIKYAAEAARAGIDAALKSISPGKTDNEVAAALYQATIAAGSEYIGHPPMVVSGKRSALCFALWKRHQIERGDVVLLENGACYHRYHALMARSAVVGRPTDEHKATAEALVLILETAIDTIRPGIAAGEVDRICRSKIRHRGLEKYYKSRTAYGLGIGFPPNWAEGHIYAIRPGEQMVLRRNMTFHVIPTMFREDFGMAISDTVIVTEDGCEALTHYPRDLFVID